MKFRNIKINIKITNSNIYFILYDLNFGVLYSTIIPKKYANYINYKNYIIEYLIESGILKIKNNNK